MTFIATAGHAGLLGALEVALTMADARLLAPARTLSASPHADVRARAVLLLGALGSAEGVLLVERALDDPDPSVRQAALRSLASLGHWPAAARVAALMHDVAWDVRRQAALCLRAFGPPGFIYLRRLRESDDLVASAVARYALDLAAAGASA